MNNNISVIGLGHAFVYQYNAIKKYFNNNDVLYINLYSVKNELLNRYEIKNKLRKSNWSDNIDIIGEISEYLLNNSKLNILSYDIDTTLKEVYLYVEKFLYA